MKLQTISTHRCDTRTPHGTLRFVVHRELHRHGKGEWELEEPTHRLVWTPAEKRTFEAWKVEVYENAECINVHGYGCGGNFITADDVFDHLDFHYVRLHELEPVRG